MENLSIKAEIIAREMQVEAPKVAKQGVYMKVKQGERTVLEMLDSDQELLDAQVASTIAQKN